MHWLSSSLPAQHPLLAGAPPHLPCLAGQAWEWDGVRFEMLHPSPELLADSSARPNARSCTLKISYAMHAALLTGDIEAPQERALVAATRAALRADVLLAPHHGSGTSSTGMFLDAVHPSVALFQVGYRNRYHHPKPEIIDRYVARDIQIVRTDQFGAVRLVFDENFDNSEHTAFQMTRYRCEHQRYWSAEACPVAMVSR